MRSRHMYFADLTPCSYDGIPEPEGLSVGWLDKTHHFDRGEVPAGFTERLDELCRRPYIGHRGSHICEFCAGADSAEVIRVVGQDGAVYYSPAMIHHYVVQHGYRPPDDFVRAVMGRE